MSVSRGCPGCALVTQGNGGGGGQRQKAGSWRIQICPPGPSFSSVHQEAPGLIQRPTVVDSGERLWGDSEGRTRPEIRLRGRFQLGNVPAGRLWPEGGGFGPRKGSLRLRQSRGLCLHPRGLPWEAGVGGSMAREGADPPCPGSPPLQLFRSVCRSLQTPRWGGDRTLDPRAVGLWGCGALGKLSPGGVHCRGRLRGGLAGRGLNAWRKGSRPGAQP